MNNARLTLEERNDTGSGKANRLRKSDYIPAVIYGQGANSRSVQVNARELRQFLSAYGKNALFNTEFAAEQDVSMLVKDIQYHPVKKDIVHVDLQRVSMTEKIHAEVPIRNLGAERVEKNGNVVVHQLSQIVVECLPQDAPRYIDAELSSMSAGNSLTAGQLKLPQGVTLVTDPNSVILSVTGGKPDLQVDKKDEPVRPAGEEGEVQAVPV